MLHVYWWQAGVGMEWGMGKRKWLTINTDSSHYLIGPLILNDYSDIYGKISNINVC